MAYKPLNDLLLVEKLVDAEDMQTKGGIILPAKSSVLREPLIRLKVLRVGIGVHEIKEDDVVIAENMFQPIRKDENTIGLINQKYVHVVEL